MATIDPKTKDVILDELERLQLLGVHYKEHHNPLTLVDGDTNTVIGRVDLSAAHEVAKNHRIHAIWKSHRVRALTQIRHLGSYDVAYLARRPVRIQESDGTIQEVHPRVFRFMRDHGRVICEGVVLETLT